MMNFKLIKPCSNCPFRKDSLKGWLGKERSTEIADAILKEDLTFTCHKTLGKREVSHCVGALLLLKHDIKTSPFGNSKIQIAERLGLFEPDKLIDEGICFKTKEEFVNHHTKGNHHETV